MLRLECGGAEIKKIPKAESYLLVKCIISLEKYLLQVKNTKHKIELSRFRLSSHSLMVEKGRYMRPRIERHERKCFICKDDIEDEIHLLIKCPLYNEERTALFQSCRENTTNFDQLLTDKQKFILAIYVN